MANAPNRDIHRIAEAFAISQPFVTAGPYGNGHINDTYVVEFSEQRMPKRYIVQRINGQVFADIPLVMQNIGRVTRHVRSRLEMLGADDIDRRTLTIVPTRDGRDYYLDTDGSYWRAYVFIERAHSYDLIETPERAYQAARAFGEFARLIDALPLPRLHDTLPHFHDTRERFAALARAVDEDAHNLARDVAKEIAFCAERERLAGALEILRGMIPERIAHNDTKMNNVLIDDSTDCGLCVVDLDTVMQGLSLYDFGDMIRTAALPIAEDSQDLTNARVSLPMFEAVTRGYVEGMGDLLGTAESASLVLGAKVLTFESGVRFLTDHLQGNRYFQVERPGQNIDRARTQFALLASLEAHEFELNACVIRVIRESK